MKLVIIGGTGLIGSKLVTRLREHGHEAVPASPDTGVNTLTGEGLAEALQGASVVVDVSNSPSFEDTAVMEFFTTSTRNLLEYAAAAGVRHYVALSVVGTERIPDSPYLRAKNAQETLIKGGGIPYSIVHATQFFEFVKRIADEATDGTTVRLPPVLIQPMAADDVAKAVGRIAVGAPLNGTVEVAGPQQFRFDELIRQGLGARNDPREVVVDPHARYFGAELGERSLVPAGEARLGEIHFQEWQQGQSTAMSGPDRQLTVMRPPTGTRNGCRGPGAEDPADDAPRRMADAIRSSFFRDPRLDILGALTDAELDDPEVGQPFWQNRSCAAIASISSRLFPTARMIRRPAESSGRTRGSGRRRSACSGKPCAASSARRPVRGGLCSSVR